jgi:hypothetical protein
MKLVAREYVWDDLRVQQNYFIQTVFEVAPECYEDLRSRVSPVPEHLRARGLLDRQSQEPFDPIIQWSERWHLTDPWILGPVHIFAYEGFRADKEWWYGPLNWAPSDPASLSLNVLGFKYWEILRALHEQGDEAKAKTILRATFEEKMDELFERIDRTATSLGYVKTPKVPNLDYFRWLAGHHVLGWSANAIGKAVNPRAAVGYHGTIIHAISKLAEEINLTCPAKGYDSDWRADRINARLDSLPKTA